MTLCFISIVMVMWSSISSGDFRHVSASPVALQCENCHCKGMTAEKCPFQKCIQLWDDCFLKHNDDNLFKDEYFKQKELALQSYLSIPFRNLHEYIMTILSYSDNANVKYVTLKYKNTTTDFQIFSTPSPKNEELQVKSGTNQPFKSILMFEKMIELNPTHSVLDNTTNVNTVNENKNILLAVDGGLVLLWLTNVIFLCVCLHLRRPADSTRRNDVVLNRIRTDNGNTSERTHEESTILLTVNTNNVDAVPVRDALCPNENHSNNTIIV